MERAWPFFRGALLVCAVAFVTCGPDRDADPFGLDRVPGEYFAEIAIIALACPDDAPRFLPAEARILLTVDGGTLEIRGLPSILRGRIDPDGTFAVEGSHATALGQVAATMEGSFLAPLDGRGFVARLEATTPGCRQEYRVRAF